MENVILILAALYFQCISKHWLWFELIGFILQVLSLIATFFFIPESPKFLVMQRRFTEARIILERIAKVNGTDFFMFEEDDFVTYFLWVVNATIILMFFCCMQSACVYFH